ncbi:MAG: hypothetical protein ACP5SH_26485 [Syntrophobacteraceae bacterium]
MDEPILFVAIGCGRLPGMLARAARHPLVVFGTMNGELLRALSSRPRDAAPAVEVFFYESG